MDELTPVTLNSHGVGKLVSVRVSVVDHTAPNSLLRSQLEMEAGVRIELTIGVLQTPAARMEVFVRGDHRELQPDGYLQKPAQ